MAGAANEDLFSSVVSDIKAYQGTDPLCPWLRGIRRMRELLSSQALAEKLPRFLQKCAEAFECDRRYRNDIRYLRVWIQLMDHVDDPRRLLRRMEKNQIGVKHSAFYVAYSLYYEKQRKFEAAEKMYHVGAQKLAEPAVQLQKSYEQFLHRMELHKRRKSKVVCRHFPPIFLVNSTLRYCGGQVCGSAIVGKSEAEDACHHGLVDPTINLKEAMNAINSMFREPLELEPRPRRKLQQNIPRENPENSSGFEVFVDDDLRRRRSRQDLPEANLQNDNSLEIFVDDDPRMGRPQQNSPEANPQNNNGFEIFVDDDPRPEGNSRENPSEANPQGKNKNGFEILVDDNSDEVDLPLKDAGISESRSFVGGFKMHEDDEDESECDDGDVEYPKMREDTVICSFVGSTVAGERVVENACHSGLVDPTINLKEAIDDINSMFGKPIDFVRAGRLKKKGYLPEQKQKQKQKQSHQDFSILIDEGVDQPSKMASLSCSDGSHRDSGLFEPTMFTKEAMDDINELFGRPLDF
ncbi:unnamed protein product [Spirodela intermedia]|uniref:BUB1 N-terminal domain-containing protein n=1 Tax=Spirodela intermedia TaxID=51605 RepID=A0A7I8IHB7_SPIIN|nr:unnamed protein product [Spirodela intermedia]CAA6656897.1 unnamed protein product [Spirodela intermedia]